MNFEIKMNRKVFTITDKDRIMFNGACYISVTQRAWFGYSQGCPTVPKTLATKWIKDNALVLCGTYDCGNGIKYPLYKFVKEV